MGPTEICNMALGGLGANRINDYTDTTEDSVEAIQCRLHYEQTRNALLRSHFWRFARARATLSQNTTDPDFEWDYAYDLPNDFLRLRIKPYEDYNDGVNESKYSFNLEGTQILSNEDSMKIRYIRRVTDPNEFDPLFTEVLIIQLKLKMVIPLCGAGGEGLALKKDIKEDFRLLLPSVRAVDKLETDNLGDKDKPTWNDSRVAGAGNPLKRYS